MRRLLADLARRDAVVLGGLLLLAALIRLPGLAARGRFDGDQGHDMTVLLGMVRDGVLPLLGPPTSLGDVHHGAAYYYLLAPAALVSNADPTVVTGWIAILGIGAVAATWWLGRVTGGPLVAAVAALLLAVSPAAIEESTFIWNPNPIPLFAAIALAAAWTAHRGGSPGWWTVAIAAGGGVMSLHVLGIAFLPPLLALAAWDAAGARRAADRPRARRILLAVGAGLAIAALLWIPLLIHELQTGGGEIANLLAYLRSGGDAGAAGGAPSLGPIGAVGFVLFRVIGWPLVGLVSVEPLASVVVVSAAVVVAGVAMATPDRSAARGAARFLGLLVAWAALALTILAPSLQAIVAGLPNDHYHAYLDPVVVVLVALGVRRLVVGAAVRTPATAAGPRARPWRSRAAVIPVLAVIGLVALEVRLWPPPDPNGGWLAADAAGRRVVALAAGRAIDIRSLPAFKTAEGLGFPVLAAGADPGVATDRLSDRAPVARGSLLVIACDRLFQAGLGSDCEPPTVDAAAAVLVGGPTTPVATFPQSERITISVYAP